MSKGYYFSKSEYDKDLDLRLKLDKELKELMEEPDIIVPKRKLRSIDEIITDPQLLESEVRKDLGKIMLADDLNKAISYLKSKDELGLFYKTYDQFMQKMGNPTRLGFNNFEINWGKFDKEDVVKELKEVDRINTMERKMRIILKRLQEKPIKTMKIKEQIGKVLAFNEEIDRLKREGVDKESEEWEEMLEKFEELKEDLEGIVIRKRGKEFEESTKRASLYSKQIDDFEELMAEFEKQHPKRIKGVEDLIDSSKSELKNLNKLLEVDQPNLTKIRQKEKKIKETLEEVKDEISEVESTLPREPTETSSRADDLPFLRRAKELLIKTGKKAMPTGFSIKAIRTALDKYPVTSGDKEKIREAFNISQVIEKKKAIVDLIDEYAITGSGFNKKRRMKIIKGSIKAGNNNPELSERLWNLKYRK